MSLIQAQALEKTYRAGDVEVHAVRGVDFSIEAASFAAFVGPSGSGKSTVLNMIAAFYGFVDSGVAQFNTNGNSPPAEGIESFPGGLWQAEFRQKLFVFPGRSEGTVRQPVFFAGANGDRKSR